MMNDRHRDAYAAVVVVVLACASAALSFLYHFALALASLVSAGALHLALSGRRGGAQESERDAEAFGKALAAKYRKTGNLLDAIEYAASSCGDGLRKRILLCTREYARTGDAGRAFRDMGGTGSHTLEMLAGGLAAHLESGQDAHQYIAGSVSSMKMRERVRLRSAGAIANASSISRIAGVVFFPLFAGISLDILRMVGSINGQAGQVSVGAVAAVFAAYIAVSNYVNASWRPGRPMDIARLCALYSSAGIFIFSATSAFALSMI